MRGLVFTIVFVVFYCRSASGMIFDADTEDYLNEIIECKNIPGLAVGAIKGDLDYSQGFGLADVENAIPVRKNTRFSIGSLTKSFNMVLLGILLEERGFTWKSTIAEVLGEPFEFMDDLRTCEMTTRDMLSHRTGVASLVLGILAQYENTDPVDIVNRFKMTPPVAEFRDEFNYNNEMYVALGYLCEHLGKDKWETLLNDRLLVPLGMESTTSVIMSESELEKPLVAKPYVYRNNTFEIGTLKLYNVYPYQAAGGMLSTAKDMVKWMKFLLSRGQLENGTQLLDPDFLSEAFEAAIPVTYMPISKPTYPVSDVKKGSGYAFFTSSYRGYDGFEHGGSFFSYSSHMVIFPDTDSGLFFTMNGPATDQQNTNRAIYYYLADKVLGETPWLDSSAGCAFNTKSKASTKLDSGDDYNGIQYTKPLPLATVNCQVVEERLDYVGNYSCPLLPDMEITPRNVRALNVEINLLSGRLCSTEVDDEFLYRVDMPYEVSEYYSQENGGRTGLPIKFERDDDGNVVCAVLSLEVDEKCTKDGHNGVGSAAMPIWLSLSGVLLNIVFFYLLN